MCTPCGIVRQHCASGAVVTRSSRNLATWTTGTTGRTGRSGRDHTGLRPIEDGSLEHVLLEDGRMSVLLQPFL